MSASVAPNNKRTALIMAAVVAGMLALAFASVPLYRIFCEATGFAWTTLRADKAPGAVAGEIGVRFDANIDPGLPWRFEPEQRTVRIQPGATESAPRAPPPRPGRPPPRALGARRSSPRRRGGRPPRAG